MKEDDEVVVSKDGKPLHRFNYYINVINNNMKLKTTLNGTIATFCDILPRPYIFRWAYSQPDRRLTPSTLPLVSHGTGVLSGVRLHYIPQQQATTR